MAHIIRKMHIRGNPGFRLPCAIGRTGTTSQSGFTLIELLVVVGIIGVLGAVAVLNIGVFIGSGTDEAMLAEQHNVQTAVVAYLADGNSIEAEFLVCPGAKGVLAPYLTGQLGYCWLVGVDGRIAVSASLASPLTTLGSTFDEISTSMIALALEYYELNGSWPRSWGDYKYTDLGLDPAEWLDNPVAGVIYSPVGTRLQVRPDEGYVFEFDYADGTSGTLTNDLNWNLVYSLENEQWYFHSVSEDNAIDISTLDIVSG